jgi:hypothetical protein
MVQLPHRLGVDGAAVLLSKCPLSSSPADCFDWPCVMQRQTSKRQLRSSCHDESHSCQCVDCPAVYVSIVKLSSCLSGDFPAVCITIVQLSRGQDSSCALCLFVNCSAVSCSSKSFYVLIRRVSFVDKFCYSWSLDDPQDSRDFTKLDRSDRFRFNWTGLD